MALVHRSYKSLQCTKDFTKIHKGFLRTHSLHHIDRQKTTHITEITVCKVLIKAITDRTVIKDKGTQLKTVITFSETTFPSGHTVCTSNYFD